MFWYRLRYSPERREHVFIGDVLGHWRNEGHRLGEAVVNVCHRRVPQLRPPAVAANVLQDGHQPRSAIGAEGIPVEGLKRLDQRVLHQILRFTPIAFHPHRQPEQPIHVRHRLGLEGNPQAVGRGGIGHLSWNLRDPEDHTDQRWIYSRAVRPLRFR